MKYGEDKICDEIKKYIESTYSEHYSTTKDGFQVQDMLRHLGIDKDFCQANAIKYLARYGKKNGKNRKDLLKAIHYIVLLMTSEDEEMSITKFDEDTFILAPKPNANLTFELHYLYEPASLTTKGDSGTTWVSTNTPNLLLYGSLVEASIFMKQDLNETNMFEQRFQNALANAITLMEGRATRDENRFDRPRGFVSPKQQQQ